MNWKNNQKDNGTFSAATVSAEQAEDAKKLYDYVLKNGIDDVPLRLIDNFINKVKDGQNQISRRLPKEDNKMKTLPLPKEWERFLEPPMTLEEFERRLKESAPELPGGQPKRGGEGFAGAMITRNKQ